MLKLGKIEGVFETKRIKAGDFEPGYVLLK
jgi:hypothetical protein